jgi:hypothetical protein
VLNVQQIAGIATKDPELYEAMRGVSNQALKAGDLAVATPLTETTGAVSGLPLTFGLQSPLAWPILDKGGQWFDVKAYGAKGDGVHDDTNAVLAAYRAGAGSVIYFPSGTYLLTPSQITISAGGTIILGASCGSTFIKAVGGVSGPVFKFANGALTVNYCGIHNLHFSSADTSTQKTMIQALDAVDFRCSNIISGDNEWKGATSVGIEVKGRQEVRIRDCTLYADQPISIGDNPNLAGTAEISFDHSSVESSDLIVTSGVGNAAILIADGCVVSQSAFTNLAFVRGNDGIKFSNTTQATASVGILVQNCRSEQGNSSTAYTLNLQSTSGAIQNVMVLSVIADGTRRGAIFRKVVYSTLNQFIYGGTGVFLDQDTSCTGNTLISCFQQSGSTTPTTMAPTTYIQHTLGSNQPVNVFGITVQPTQLGGLTVLNNLNLTSKGNLTLANGRNDNIVIGDTTFIQAIAGPTGAFQLSGIVPTATNGQIVTIIYNGGQVWTINHEDVNSTAANRITCPAATNVTPSVTGGSITLIYNPGASRWYFLAKA